MDEPDIAAVAQAATMLQHRLYQLTSTWTGAPVEVHRLQETVSRACAILQSSAHSALEPPLHANDDSGSATNSRDSHEQLSRHVAIARKVLEDLVDIL